jgi:hypothetical protein
LLFRNARVSVPICVFVCEIIHKRRHRVRANKATRYTYVASLEKLATQAVSLARLFSFLCSAHKPLGRLIQRPRRLGNRIERRRRDQPKWTRTTTAANAARPDCSLSPTIQSVRVWPFLPPVGSTPHPLLPVFLCASVCRDQFVDLGLAHAHDRYP